MVITGTDPITRMNGMKVAADMVVAGIDVILEQDKNS